MLMFKRVCDGHWETRSVFNLFLQVALTVLIIQSINDIQDCVKGRNPKVLRVTPNQGRLADPLCHLGKDGWEYLKFQV
jgi:hypothetical protein